MAAPSFPITKNRIRNHFQYYWWQYFVLLVAGIFGWNLLFTTTRYQPPENLKVEWYYQGPITNDTSNKAQDLLETLWPELFPTMEEVSFNVVGTDDMYGDMQLMVWMAAGQGDLYMLDRTSFATYANESTLLDLQPYVDDGTLNVEGIDLRSGIATDPETGYKGLFGIPADALEKLFDYDIQPTRKLFCLPLGSGNIENAMIFLDYLLDNMK
ncbi:MAG: hypothetical protein IKK75_16530 [Clostridia bacterium]|nr:hypothetical protein [Clostridia bacterium]